MREQSRDFIALIWYEQDTYPVFIDTLYQDRSETTVSTFTSAATGSLWLFAYDDAIDFDTPVVSGWASMTSAASGILAYSFTSAQTVTLAADSISSFRAFWKIDWGNGNSPVVIINIQKFKIPTPLRFIKVF